MGRAILYMGGNIIMEISELLSYEELYDKEKYPIEPYENLVV